MSQEITDKAREFWLRPYANNEWSVLNYEPDLEFEQPIRVIQYSAYESAVREKFYAIDQWNEWMMQVQELQAALEAKEAECIHNFKAAENWKEACLAQQERSNDFEDKFNQARADLAEWRASLDGTLVQKYRDCSDQLTAAREREAKLVSALKFYANGNSWYRPMACEKEERANYICSRLPSDITDEGIGPSGLAGRIARDAITAHEKEPK